MNAQSNAREHMITLIPGDGIGPEITRVVVRILEATGVKFLWEEHLAGAEAYGDTRSTYRARSINPSNAIVLP